MRRRASSLAIRSAQELRSGVGLVAEREKEFEAEELAWESDGESRGLWGEMGGRAGELGPGVGLVVEKEA